MRYRFEAFTLDGERRELRRGEALCALEPQVFDLLEYLVRNRDRVLSRDEIFGALWGQRIVSDSVLSTRLYAARAAIGDDGGTQRLIRTVRGRGVRFVGAVSEEGAPRPETVVVRERPPGLLLDRPAIVVLPFANLSGDSGQDHLAGAITEELIIALSKAGWLSVLSRATAFAHRDAPLPGPEAARRHGVRYLVEGAVRDVGGRMRVTARLIDAIADHQIWAERFEGDGFDLLAVQDRIVRAILDAIEPQLYFAEEQRARAQSPEALNTWECMVRALALMNRRHKPDVILAADLLRRAVTIDPGSAQARSLLSMAVTMRVHMGWTDRRVDAPPAIAAAREAIACNPEEPWAHAALGYALTWTDPETAVRSCERAVAIAPGFAIGHYFYALATTYAGQSDDAFPHADLTEQFAHRDLLARGYAGAHDNVRATASFAGGHYREGIAFGRKAVRDSPHSPSGYRSLVINLALGGDMLEARELLRTLQTHAPEMSQHWIRQNAAWADGDDMKRYIEAFRIAGLK